MALPPGGPDGVLVDKREPHSGKASSPMFPYILSMSRKEGRSNNGSIQKINSNFRLDFCVHFFFSAFVAFISCLDCATQCSRMFKKGFVMLDYKNKFFQSIIHHMLTSKVIASSKGLQFAGFFFAL